MLFAVFVFAARSSLCTPPYSFFFQAEDGIRDATVTGVQTCALPIYILALAEDVAQDVFIKVYKALPTYRHDRPFKHWLHRVAANAVTDALRRRRPVVSLDGMEQPPASGVPDPQDVAARHDLQRAVRHAIANLPPHYRDTIALQAFGELSYDEIARALDIPLGTVMSRLNGAKRLLRE